MTARTLPLLLVDAADLARDPIDDIDSCTQVYGDWPEIDTPCDASPVGQCEYNAVAPDPEYQRCIHCGRMTG